jgi:hypothetical protein
MGDLRPDLDAAMAGWSLVHGHTYTPKMFDALRLTYDASLFCLRGCSQRLMGCFQILVCAPFSFFFEIRNYCTEDIYYVILGLCVNFTGRLVKHSTYDASWPNAFILRVI